MARTHEAPKQRIPELHFRPEGYVSSSDPEYLDQLLELLRSKGFDPDQLVFSGFNGRPIVEGQPLERYSGIFVMNEAGWRDEIKLRYGINANPAEYAERWEDTGGVPVLGLFDRGQLQQIYGYETNVHPVNKVEGSEDWTQIRMDGGEATLTRHSFGEGDPESSVLKPYEEYIAEREEFINIIPGVPLAEVPTTEPLVMAVTHKNYPEGSPIDALVGVVFLDRPDFNESTSFDF